MPLNIRRAISVAFSLAIVWLIGESIFGAIVRNKPSKKALSAMHENIELGSSREKVSKVFNQFKTTRTLIRADVLQDTWEVALPVEFGAGNWILYLQFDSSERVSAVAMRTADGTFLKPKDAPQDKGTLATPLRACLKN